MHEAAAAARFTSILVLRLADAQYPDLRLASLAKSLRDRVAEFAKGKGNEARRAEVGAKLQPSAEAFLAAATALDARADAAVARGDAAAAAKAYAQLRAAEDAFFQPNTTAWQRTLLYDVSGYESTVLPSLDATLANDGNGPLSTLQAAFAAAIAAAGPGT